MAIIFFASWLVPSIFPLAEMNFVFNREKDCKNPSLFLKVVNPFCLNSFAINNDAFSIP
jgi:hypothetical protein